MDCQAFDSLPHRSLLAKLEAYGIRGTLGVCIKDLLTGRKQCMSVSGALLSLAEVLSGIPQGSILGPLLFILFVNDIPEAVHGYIQKLTNDTKVYRDMCLATNQHHLQVNLDALD